MEHKRLLIILRAHGSEDLTDEIVDVHLSFYMIYETCILECLIIYQKLTIRSKDGTVDLKLKKVRITPTNRGLSNVYKKKQSFNEAQIELYVAEIEPEPPRRRYADAPKRIKRLVEAFDPNDIVQGWPTVAHCMFRGGAFQV